MTEADRLLDVWQTEADLSQLLEDRFLRDHAAIIPAFA
jgi:hypothetical protein